MRFRQYMNEEWFETYTGRKYEVLKNPSTRDMNKLLKGSDDARFIMDRSKKNVWVWNAKRAIHQTVYNNLFITGKSIFGIAQRIKGKWSMVESDEMENYIKHQHWEYKDVIEEILNTYLWANKCIDIKHFIGLMEKGDLYDGGF